LAENENQPLALSSNLKALAFGVYLSAKAFYRLYRKSPAIRLFVKFLTLYRIIRQQK